MVIASVRAEAEARSRSPSNASGVVANISRRVEFARKIGIAHTSNLTPAGTQTMTICIVGRATCRMGDTVGGSSDSDKKK